MTPISQGRLLAWPRGPSPGAPLPSQLEQGEGLWIPALETPHTLQAGTRTPGLHPQRNV